MPRLPQDPGPVSAWVRGNRWLLLAVAAALVLVALPTTLLLADGPSPPTSTPASTDQAAAGSFHGFDEVAVTSDFEVAGAGRNVDSIAFWDAPDPSDTLMFVTSKNASLVEVWKHPFDSASVEREPLRHDCLEAGQDSATNGVVVDQESDELYVASNFSPNVCVFSLPRLTHRRTISSGVTYGLEPNLALLELPEGAKRLYVSNNDVVYVHDATTGQKLSQFTPARGLETMWADGFDQLIYIPDENDRSGVYAYRPDGRPYQRAGLTVVGGGEEDVFDSDAEGILEYTCPGSGDADDGTGLIVVSDQVDDADVGNDYEVFDRRTWTHLGRVKLRLPDESGFVHNTDGIGTTQQASEAYPSGLFTAVQDDSSVVGVGWDKLFRAISRRTGSPFGCG